MTTRGMIEVYGPRGPYARIYVHYDMYPDGNICQVAKFLSDKHFGGDDDFKTIYGMDNLAAMLVAYLINYYTKIAKRRHKGGKEDLAAGAVYLYPPGVDSDAQYLYQLLPISEDSRDALDAIWVFAKGWDYDLGKFVEFFSGTLRDYAKQFCKAQGNSA